MLPVLRRSLSCQSLLRRPCRSSYSSAASPVHSIAEVPSAWKALSVEERAALSRQLDDKVTQDWNSLSREEKRAAYYIAFGPHGPRAPTDSSETSKLVVSVVAVLAASLGLVMFIAKNGQETPPTLTKEWKEQTKEYLEAQKADPISAYAVEMNKK